MSTITMDLTRWLQNDLGLRNMTEADLNSLVYHPRHGSLCRRFLTFLTETTLSSKKYPNIYAREECDEAHQELEARDQELGQTKLELERQLQTSSNTELELKFLKDRHQYIVSLEDLLRTTTVALEEIANRPNVAFERVRRVMDQTNYLSNDDLERIYSFDDSLAHPAAGCPPTDEDFNKSVKTIETLHRALSFLLTDVSNKVEANAVESRTLRQPNVESLEALKIPECERLELISNPEEFELADKRATLEKAVELVEVKVKALEEKLKVERQRVEEHYRKQRQIDLDFLDKLQQLERELYAPAD